MKTIKAKGKKILSLILTFDMVMHYSNNSIQKETL